MKDISQDDFLSRGSAEKQPTSQAALPAEAQSARMAELELVAEAISASDIGVYRIDVVSGEVFVAGSWRKIMGVGADEEVCYQSEWRARVHPEDLQKIASAHQECIDGRTSRVVVEYRLRARDGQDWFWMCSDTVASERDSK